MRTKALVTTVCVIFVPTLLIYYVYYDSLYDRTVTQPRHSSAALVGSGSSSSSSNNVVPILTDSVQSHHKYAGIWENQLNQGGANGAAYNASRRAAVRALFKAPPLPTPAASRDPTPGIETKRAFVREMMKDAWSNYARYAWGYNELKPESREPKTDSIFGSAKIGATIVDSLDTLLLMDLKAEFATAKDWLATSFHFAATENEVSVFETVIRYVGGLLTVYAMTGDELFLNKSLEVAEALLPAYATETGKMFKVKVFFYLKLTFHHPPGLPHGLIVPATKRNYHHSWAFGSILSEMGSQQLEYSYLSDMTGDGRFRDAVLRIRNRLDSTPKQAGLYMTMMDSSTGRWNENKSTMGALGDSFYEYLLKSYVQSAHRDPVALRMYREAMAAVERAGMLVTSRTGLLYFADWIYGKTNNKMQHLTCFSGGMYALGAHHLAMDLKRRKEAEASAHAANFTAEEHLIAHHMALAVNITETCFQSYNRTPTKLGPESFFFDDEDDATNRNGDMYILR